MRDERESLQKRRPHIPAANVVRQRRRIEHRGQDRRRRIENVKLLEHALSAAERRQPIRRDRDSSAARLRGQYAPLPLRTTPTVLAMI